MSQENNNELIGWWNECSLPEKELFQLDENGTLTLRANSNIKERVITTFDLETKDAVLKNLQEKFASLQSKVKELEVEWLATEDKLKLADKVAHLKEHLQKAVAIGDFEKLALLIHDWEHTIYQLSEENYAVKLKLAELAESLAESDQWKDTTIAFKEIAEKWKHSGHLDKGRNDKLWNRIEAARHTFYERKRQHHEDEEKDLLHNLDLKIDLVEQAESLAHSTDWKVTTEVFHRLTEEWKTIGHTVNKKNEELWQRFLAAKSTFFDAKRAHFGQVQQEQEANYAIKLALVEKAEALRESTEWSATAQAYAALMEEWKKTGRVPHIKSEELWKRFTEAQEQFFSAKRQHTDHIKGEQENNYNLKKEILERAEQIKNSTHWGEVTGEMNDLMDQWKKIGPVPRVYGDKLWEDFNAARKYFFARKDANREHRKQYAETQKVARVEQAKNLVFKLEHEIKEEEEKLLDFQNGIENITPGKKAEELRVHLETLIADTTQKIKRLKEKHAALMEESKAHADKLEPSSSGNAE